MGGGAGKPEPRGASGTLGGGALLAAAGPLFRWPAESDEPRTGTERKLRPLGLSPAATRIAGAPPSELGTAGWLHQSHSTPFIPLPRHLQVQQASLRCICVCTSPSLHCCCSLLLAGRGYSALISVNVSRYHRNRCTRLGTDREPSYIQVPIGSLTLICLGATIPLGPALVALSTKSPDISPFPLANSLHTSNTSAV